jgi:hypothetical protein
MKQLVLLAGMFLILLLLTFTAPEFMLVVYAQNDTAEEDSINISNITIEECSADAMCSALKTVREEMNLRKNASTVDAQTPIMFNSIQEGDIPPIPKENQIMIEISAIAPGTGRTDLGWRGNVAYNDGRDMLSFDGVYKDYILVNCFAYDRYSVSFQKTDAEGYLDVMIWYRDADYDKPGIGGGEKILDEGRTEAAYGIVQLSGTCEDPMLSNPIR